MLRPSRRLVLTAMVPAVLTAAVCTGGLAFRYGWQAALVTALICLVLLALLAGYVQRARIILTVHDIIVKGLFIQRRRSRAHAAGVVRATLVPVQGPALASLFVLDAHRDLLIRVHASYFATEDVDRLVGALGLPCDAPAQPVTAKELAKTYPGILPWVERHPYLFAFAVAGGVLVAGLLVVLVVLVAEVQGYI